MLNQRSIEKPLSLAERIYSILVKHGQPLSIKEIHDEIQDKPRESIRGRIYDNIGKKFQKVARGVYWIEKDDAACVVIEADGRQEGLQLLNDNCVDAILTDHPYDVPGNYGTNRNFTSEYSCFQYTLDDFKEKARVLKNGGFLIEFLPTEGAGNFEYLYKLKIMAKEAGLFYYAKVPWKKGNFCANLGKSKKNSEDIMIFFKGPQARALRPDKKKILKGFKDAKMSGSAFMLPTEFDYQPPTKKERIHQAEKPVDLLVELLEAFTLPGEIVVDQFAGSGVLGAAALKLKNRIAILFESLHENVKKIAKRLNAKVIYKEDVDDKPIISYFSSKKKDGIKKPHLELTQLEFPF